MWDYFQCALDTSYWTGFNHFVIWGSIFFYFAFTFVFYSELFDYTYLGSAENVMGTANFMFTLILTVTILLLPVVAARFYQIDTRPTLTEKVRLKQRISKSKSKSADLILRRASTMRRSQRSLRSGYAFCASGRIRRADNDRVHHANKTGSYIHRELAQVVLAARESEDEQFEEYERLGRRRRPRSAGQRQLSRSYVRHVRAIKRLVHPAKRF